MSLPVSAFYRTELKRLEQHAVMAFSPHMLGVRAEILRSEVSDRFELMARGFVWAEDEAVRRVEWKHPADWWQAFKARWYPRWALKRWPVVDEVHKFDVECIYPEFRPKVSGQTFRLLVPGVDTLNAPREWAP